MQSYSVYLHIPFCRHLCSYCDFNTYAGLDELIPTYVDSLCNEIEFVANNCDQRLSVHTIFIGGGTPSILPIEQLEQIIHTMDRVFDIDDDSEITMEANPGRLGIDYLKSLRSLGVNRLSLGMQSAIPEELKLLDRQHDFMQTAEALQVARNVGFDNINLDLIFGIPYQSIETWQTSLDLALTLIPDHFSLYALSIEPGTSLNTWLSKGLISAPDADLAAEMYETAADKLHNCNYHQYEISNWARKDADLGVMACRHNLQYWRNLPYLGFGAGAHGFSGEKRTANVGKPDRYIEKIRSWENVSSQDELSFPLSPATAKATSIDTEEEIKETMMMGLRLTDEGVSRSEFQSRFGLALEDEYGEEIDELVELGLLEWDQETTDKIRLTTRGRLLGNQVFRRFI